MHYRRLSGRRTCKAQTDLLFHWAGTEREKAHFSDPTK